MFSATKNAGRCELQQGWGKQRARSGQCPVTSLFVHRNSSERAQKLLRWPFGHNRHGPKSGGGLLCPFGEGELSPHLTQCDLSWDLSPYQVASWSIQPFGRNGHGPKSCRLLYTPLWGELGPHLTQCGLCQGLPPYQVTSRSIQPCGATLTWAENWGLGHLFRGAGSHLTQCGLSRGLPTCHVSSWSIQPFGHNTPTLQTGQTGQDRTDRQTTVR